MTPRQAQINYCIAHGLVTEELLRELQGEPDICAALFEREVINSDQAAALEQLAAAHDGSREAATELDLRPVPSLSPPARTGHPDNQATLMLRPDGGGREAIEHLRKLSQAPPVDPETIQLSRMGLYDSQERPPGAPGTRRVGSLRLQQRIGEGQVGEVYRAEGPEGVAAVKLIKPEAMDAASLARFEREARVLSQLSHPHIVTYLGSGRDEESSWLATRYVEGADLSTIVRRAFSDRRQPPDPYWMLSLLADIAGALAYCHGRGLLHRDVKPGNILVETSTGRALLGDFGLVSRNWAAASAEQVEGVTQTLSSSHEMHGTPSFIAPEFLDESLGPVGAAADVYALGGTLYFALCGQPPHSGESLQQILGRARMGVVRPLSELAPELPEWVYELVSACLAKQPAGRPTAAQVSERLRAGLSGKEGTSAQPYHLLWSIAAGLALVFGLALGALTRATPGEWAVQPLATSALVRVPQASLSGVWSQPRCALRITPAVGAELSVETDARGRFTATVPLQAGLNLIRVAPPAGYAAQSILVECDVTPPQLIIEGLRDDGTWSGQRLRGVAWDGHLQAVEVNGAPVEVLVDGRFFADLPLGLEDGATVTVTAQDSVGNEARKVLTIRAE